MNPTTAHEAPASKIDFMFIAINEANTIDLKNVMEQSIMFSKEDSCSTPVDHTSQSYI